MGMTQNNPASVNQCSKNNLNHNNSKEKMKMRKGMKKFIVMFLAIMMIVMNTMPAFAATTTAKTNSAGGYSVPASMTLQVGEKKTFKVTEPTGKYANVSFQYTPTYVSTSGYSAGAYWGKPAEITFTGKTPGTFNAIATVDIHSKAGIPDSSFAKYNLYCKVTVVKKGTSAPTSPAKKIALQKITLNKSSLNVNVGSTVQLSVSYSPVNTTDSKSVMWSSSNTSVATVSGGKVTAKKAGTAIITAKVGSKTSTCKVTVKAPLKSISLNKSSASVIAGKTVSLSVTYNPTNTTDSKSVTWSSSNTSVATVSGGKVTAKKAGAATITAKVGTKTATCKVTVKAAPSGGSTTAGTKTDTGSYKNVSDAYNVLNTFRTTKTNQWYWNSGNTSKVTTYGLKSLKRDTALENTAKTRAKEAWTMYYEKGRATHTRPNGSDCFTAYPAGLKYKGENLAWGQTTSNSVILDPTWGWAETNAKYAGQGHRRNMLDSRFTKVGIACYVKDGKTCWAMCLGN